MTIDEKIELLKFLSAVESWTFSIKERFPDYLSDKLSENINALTDEVLNTCTSTTNTSA